MIPQILSLDNTSQIIREMRNIGVDKIGIDIMAPKTQTYIIKIKALPNVSANILKQQMLSLGGDAAISKDVITAKKKSTDVLLFGTISEIQKLTERLLNQPFGLPKLSQEIKMALDNYRREDFLIKLPNFDLKLGRKTYIMGIVNLTPDSFSGDGIYKNQKSTTAHFQWAGLPSPYSRAVAKIKDQRFLDSVINRIEKMVSDGADIIDIGGESSRPGARPISAKEEIERVIPVLKKLVKRINTPISIDTYKPEVAKRALDLGVSIINDITSLKKNPKMAKLISSYKAGLILMHMKGRPLTMQRAPNYKDLISEIIDYLNRAINFALDFGIEREKIIIDPGIGFGKTTEHNLEILRRLKEFKVLGRPILIGVSRKSFIGNVLNKPIQERLFGTLTSVSLAIAHRADIVRVHDVKEVSDTVKLCDAILKNARY